MRAPTRIASIVSRSAASTLAATVGVLALACGGSGGQSPAPADAGSSKPSETDAGATPACAEADCTRALAATPCPGGSSAAPAGTCARMDGACRWTRRVCPARNGCEECPGDQDCFWGRGKCTAFGESWERPTCAPRPSSCPAGGTPVCGCDGKNYSSACEAARAGASVAVDGECTTGGRRCTVAKPRCGAKEFCESPRGTCALEGVCNVREIGCGEGRGLLPACGCDGRSYGYGCDREAAHVSHHHIGPCDSDPGACGGVKKLGCPSTSFCLYEPPDAACGGEGGATTGYCKPRPTSCPKNLDRVCGCDGKTYDNECLARLAGTDFVKRGACG